MRDSMAPLQKGIQLSQPKRNGCAGSNAPKALPSLILVVRSFGGWQVAQSSLAFQ